MVRQSSTDALAGGSVAHVPQVRARPAPNGSYAPEMLLSRSPPRAQVVPRKPENIEAAVPSRSSTPQKVKAMSIPLHEIASPCRGAWAAMQQRQQLKTASSSPSPVPVISAYPQSPAPAALSSPLRLRSGSHTALPGLPFTTGSYTAPPSIAAHLLAPNYAPTRHRSVPSLTNAVAMPFRQASAAVALDNAAPTPSLQVSFQPSSSGSTVTTTKGGAGQAPQDNLELALEELRLAKNAVAVSRSAGTAT